MTKNMRATGVGIRISNCSHVKIEDCLVEGAPFLDVAHSSDISVVRATSVNAAYGIRAEHVSKLNVNGFKSISSLTSKEDSADNRNAGVNGSATLRGKLHREIEARLNASTSISPISPTQND